MNITNHGTISVPQFILEAANEIKTENYKVNTPTRYQRNVISEGTTVEIQIGNIAMVSPSIIDWTFFSVCSGAEPHIDTLLPHLTDTTYVIPIILPKGKSMITVDGESVEVELDTVYQFDHTKIHSMELEDTESGCVVIMAGIKK